MTSREEFRKYRSAAHKQEINIHGGTYSDVPDGLRDVKDKRKVSLTVMFTFRLLLGAFFLGGRGIERPMLSASRIPWREGGGEKGIKIIFYKKNNKV